MKNPLTRRWLYLILGVCSMLFAGIIYAWSILKSPFASEMNWDASQLALNFTITMTFFCLGGFVGAQLSKHLGVAISVITAGVLAAAGFLFASMLDGSNIVLLYLSYGVLAGLGIGIAAAGCQRQGQNQGQNDCNGLFHSINSPFLASITQPLVTGCG